MTSSPLAPTDLYWYINTGNSQRLVYTEHAARLINELGKPAYRLSLIRGNWPPAGKPPAERILRIVEEVGILGNAANRGDALRSHSVPALSVEQEAAAAVMLELLDYCCGRNIDLGRAVLLLHTHLATQQGMGKQQQQVKR